MKDTLIKIKNNLQGINSTMDKDENQISSLEYKEAKNNQSKQKEEKEPPKNIQKIEDSITSLWDNFKCTNIHNMREPEGEELQQVIKTYVKK